MRSSSLCRIIHKVHAFIYSPQFLPPLCLSLPSLFLVPTNTNDSSYLIILYITKSNLSQKNIPPSLQIPDKKLCMFSLP